MGFRASLSSLTVVLSSFAISQLRCTCFMNTIAELFVDCWRIDIVHSIQKSIHHDLRKSKYGRDSFPQYPCCSNTIFAGYRMKRFPNAVGFFPNGPAWSHSCVSDAHPNVIPIVYRFSSDPTRFQLPLPLGWDFHLRATSLALPTCAMACPLYSRIGASLVLATSIAKLLVSGMVYRADCAHIPSWDCQIVGRYYPLCGSILQCKMSPLYVVVASQPSRTISFSPLVTVKVTMCFAFPISTASAFAILGICVTCFSVEHESISTASA
ncbi:hypothetical protein Pelo_4264 [Pelomyxa schiedti]|nr:hypothetical protein Pelo_4264 [Pelomyxa schiedti]